MLAWTIQSFQCSSSVPFENPGTTTRVSKQDENTPFYMLERLIELKVAITAAGVEQFKLGFSQENHKNCLSKYMKRILGRQVATMLRQMLLCHP